MYDELIPLKHQSFGKQIHKVPLKVLNEIGTISG